MGIPSGKFLEEQAQYTRHLSNHQQGIRGQKLGGRSTEGCRGEVSIFTCPYPLNHCLFSFLFNGESDRDQLDEK
jgi:hypothetical protein